MGLGPTARLEHRKRLIKRFLRREAPFVTVFVVLLFYLLDGLA
jgi:hypothetical protein